jgi:Carboxypeptidase regulatory-like domain/TonB dependent receptor-like, beta-barrel
MFLRKKAILAVVFLLAAGIFSIASGQVLTGTIRGTVKDDSGAVLPGVSVELKSPALIGGPRASVTSAGGLFIFRSLPPGIYDLTFSLAGFQTLKREGISIGMDVTVTEDVVLKVAAIAEEIVVTGKTPLVDVTRSGISTTFKPDMVDNLPSLRTCYFDLVNSAPGVWSPGGNTDSYRNVAFGSSEDSNIYLFDGADVTAPDFGAAWAWLNYDILEEVQVIGIGAKAEYGSFMGATVNVLTKSGGNEFHGGINGFLQFDALTADNSKTYLRDLLKAGYITEDQMFPYHRQSFLDGTVQLGGPILKDKIWFFVMGWWKYDCSTPVGTDPAYYTAFDDKHAFLKLTVQLTKNLKLSGFHNGAFYQLDDPFTPDLASLDTVYAERGTTPTTKLSLTYIASDRTLLELTVNHVGGHDFYDSKTNYKGPTYYDYNTNIRSGSPPWSWYVWYNLLSGSATLSHFAENFIAGDHDFKLGVQFADNHADNKSGYQAGIAYATYTYPDGSMLQYKYAMNPYAYGAANKLVGVFVDDTWKVSSRLALNIGFRYDHNTGSIPDLAVLAVDPNTYEWHETGATVPGKPDLVKWRVFSPRFGLAYSLTADGKTLFRVNAGRYYDKMTYGNWNLPSPATPVWYMYWWSGTAWDPVTSYSPEQVSVDPHLKNPYSDQFSVGVDRELFVDCGLSVTYMEKWTKDWIGFAPAVGDWNNYYELVSQTDPMTGAPLQAYNLLDQYPNIMITNPDRYHTRFRMLSIVANKRMSHNWQLSASFTFSKMWGLTPGGVGKEATTSEILYNSSESKDPNSFLNIEGLLSGDRPYSIKILGTYMFPYDINASVNFQVQAGPPYARAATIWGLNQGTKTLAVESRGENGHRFPAAYQLDLNVEKTFRLSSKLRLLARLDVFNVLNRSTPYSMMKYTLVPGDEWVYGSIWLPRRAQFALKLRF